MAHWKYALCSCFDDIPTCLIGCICPCYLFGQNAEQTDESNKNTPCAIYALSPGCHIGCVVHEPKQAALRDAYRITEEPNGLLVICCCSACDTPSRY
ncbi:unnamed protein product [Rotaria magnacalcarata]|uniref:Cornifelin n=1 Tax=Rotaria magnacalcarata TaxID=392030 RepID=A0A814YH97_9BILA|nr:unnamed protein product [Rotaria magnacalcarata]CAF1379478.1 unnamed protein product [Rotaria magnacalcarata]CAF2095845.1 unnamed protein product [Rotaria magnacalcarata]CAF2193107.1 unnamed protein product [Rotaria magnacalcarata]CAF4324439.1 unnamed protein product [Rotaria magnacalcarata]